MVNSTAERSPSKHYSCAWMHDSLQCKWFGTYDVCCFSGQFLVWVYYLIDQMPKNLGMTLVLVFKRDFGCAMLKRRLHSRTWHLAKVGCKMKSRLVILHSRSCSKAEYTVWAISLLPEKTTQRGAFCVPPNVLGRQVDNQKSATKRSLPEHCRLNLFEK